jgi:hypothetical protein
VVAPALYANWCSTGEDPIEAGDPLAKCALSWPCEEPIEFVSSSLPETLPAMNEDALNKLRLTPWLYDVKKPWLAVAARTTAWGRGRIQEGEGSVVGLAPV